MRAEGINIPFRSLILGLGSEVLADSGIGPILVSRLQKRLPACLYEFATSPLGGWELIDIIKDKDFVLIIDSIFSETEPTGRVDFHDKGLPPESCNLSCSHDLSFDLMLQLADKCGIGLPDEIRIATVVIDDNLTITDALHPSLAARLPEITRQIMDYITTQRDELLIEREINTMHHGLQV
jgi:hydrogenase maturation protease